MQWSVVGQVATLEWSGWKWTFQLLQPRLGLQLRPPGASAAWQALQIHPLPHHTCQIDDWFSRGSDLMVRYGQSAEDQFAFQVDCRAVSADELGPFAAGFDVWLSVQTQLLDSHPMLEVRSELPGSRWQSLATEGDAAAQPNQAALLVCQSHEGSGAVMIHPSDQAQSQLRDCAADIRVRLFGNFMEKGVIRRGRLRCLFGLEGVSNAELTQLAQRFAQSPLPLTT